MSLSTRNRGEGTVMDVVVRESSLGFALVAATSRGVSAIALGDERARLTDEVQQRFPLAVLRAGDGLERLDALAEAVLSLIDHGRAANLPLDLIGTAFEERVWRALCAIAPGTTLTYAALAHRIGAPRAARAVGAACAKNPIAVAVPCHRVVREDGALGGYRWGIARKRTLLAREASWPKARAAVG